MALRGVGQPAGRHGLRSESGRVTTSIGITSWAPDQNDDVTAVIKAVDEALCNAKATGRNKVSAVHSFC
jgi:PleD family two-component response regulator